MTAILTAPHAEWPVVADEAADVVSLYMNYVLVLAAIPAVSLVVGLVLFGVPLLGGRGVAAALGAGVSAYVSTLVTVLVTALVVERLAPKFGSRGDTAQALKLVAYSWTPVWVGGVIYVVLALSPLIVLAGLHALYLFYVGLPYVMKTPRDQVLPFVVVAALVMVVLNIVLQSVISAMGVPLYF